MSDQPRKYVIWSEEHGAWWGAVRMGYTRSLAEAGRYTREEALQIVKDANEYIDPRSGRLFNEIYIDVDLARVFVKQP